MIEIQPEKPSFISCPFSINLKIQFLLQRQSSAEDIIAAIVIPQIIRSNVYIVTLFQVSG